MKTGKIDSLVDKIISKHEAQEDARIHAAFVKKLRAIELIIKAIVIAVVFGPIIFAFSVLFSN